VIAISETWLKPSITSGVVALPGYSLIRNDRLGKTGGGVAAFIKKGLKYRQLYLSPGEYSAKPEFIFLEIGSSCSDALLLGVCYRPPGVGHLADFENILLRLMPSYSRVLIMGDFNCDLLKPDLYQSRQLMNMFASCNMTILPLDPTHHTAEAETTLDLMIVSDPLISIYHGQLPVPAISRHDLIYCVLVMRAPKPEPKIITYRNFRNLNEEHFLSDVISTPWDSIHALESVNDMVETLNDTILKLYDKHAPIVTRRINKKHSVPWISDVILELMARRDAVHRRAKRSGDPGLMAQYRRLRNQVKQQLRNSRIRYIYGLFSARKQSSTVLWRNVKKLGIGKQDKSIPISLPLNALNDHFLSFSSTSSSIAVQNHLIELNIQSNLNSFHPKFYFRPILQIEVLRAIRRITSDATGSDQISISLIKRILFALLPTLTFIFNTSLKTGIFPEKWKFALVRPLNKISSPSLPKDFRPISILPALSKALERVVHSQLSDFLTQNNILNPFQSGFRRSHSTETALIKITDDIRSAMDRSQCTILTLFDFSKAFDTVNHDILLTKLKILGFSMSSLSWMRSYLQGRKQCVCHDKMTSDWKTVSCGVPQGSILGPLLFTIYTNDISSVLHSTKFHSYADDLQIYAHFKVSEMDETVTQMNDDIDRIVQWAERNGLRLNPDKTQPIVIGHSRLLNRLDLDNATKITVNNTLLPYRDKVKSLGLALNNTLDWTDAVVNTCKKVFAAIHTLKKMQQLLPFHIKLLLIKSLVFPHFNYCNTVINDMTVALATKLQRVQNYCIRFLFNLQRDDRVTPYYIQASLLKLSDLRQIRIIQITHSVINNGVPNYLAAIFEFLGERGVRNTRSGSSTLRIPRHKTTIFNKSFVVTACRLWNSLPTEIRCIENRSRLTAALKQYYFDRMIAAWRDGVR
jgi:hypothetical protein